MKIIAKPLLLAFLATSIASCQIDVKGIKGSGNVTTQTRNITEPFTGIDASSGMDVAISHGPQSVTVEADDNVQKHIITKVENGVLKISSDHSSFINVKSRKVIVNMPKITMLEASSGVSMWSTETLKANDVKVRAKSGSSVKLTLQADRADCESSSGSSLTIVGKALELKTSSSSGSTLDASEMMANEITAESSSGSTTTVHALVSLKADASSGSSIRYKGTPRQIASDSGSGGSVSKI